MISIDPSKHIHLCATFLRARALGALTNGKSSRGHDRKKGSIIFANEDLAPLAFLLVFVRDAGLPLPRACAASSYGLADCRVEGQVGESTEGLMGWIGV